MSFMREAEKVSWFPSIFLAECQRRCRDSSKRRQASMASCFCPFRLLLLIKARKELKSFARWQRNTNFQRSMWLPRYLPIRAAKILTEALKKAGKDLSREKLIQVLEGLYEYRTGLTPAISYGPNRRIGAMGAYVVTVDLKAKQFVPASGWIGIN